jgi:hypothetical protein
MRRPSGFYLEEGRKLDQRPSQVGAMPKKQPSIQAVDMAAPDRRRTAQRIDQASLILVGERSGLIG